MFLVIQQLIDKDSTAECQSSRTIIPETFNDQALKDYKKTLHNFYVAADVNGSGYLDIEEFKLFLAYLNLCTLNEYDIKSLKTLRKRKDRKE